MADLNNPTENAKNLVVLKNMEKQRGSIMAFTDAEIKKQTGLTRQQAAALIASSYTGLNAANQAVGLGGTKKISAGQQFANDIYSNVPVIGFINKLLTGPDVTKTNTAKAMQQAAINKATQTPPSALFQDSDKASRAQVAVKVPPLQSAPAANRTVDTSRGQDSWDRNPVGTGQGIELTQPSDYYDILGMGDQVQFPNLPAPPKANFKINDFTNQANEASAKAYSPLYAALDAQNQQDQQNYNIAKTVVDGIYKQLVGANEQSAQNVNNQYSQAIQNSGNIQQQTQDSINQGYATSQQQLADMVKSFGDGGDVAASILSRGAQDQGRYNARAAEAGQQQQNFLTNEQQSANQYNTGITNANRTESVVQQQNLLRQLGNAQQDVNQQRLGYQSQQAQQALQLAQQLSGQDLNLQQMNYGGQRDQYNSIVQALTGKANFDQANMNTQIGIMQQAAQLAMQNNQFQQQQVGAQAKAQNDAEQQRIDNANKQLQIIIDAANAGFSIDPNTGSLIPIATGKDDNPLNKRTDPGSKILTTAMNFTGDLNEAQKYASLVQAQAATVDFNASNPAAFAQALAEAAKTSGLDPNVAWNVGLQAFGFLNPNTKGN